ncbi:hypothetical protein [Kitasatospora sp. MAP5-34]|uniref:hypothetical protein n=1 Tax=Kitasatospora sp. MAP5-34 TaxID=3035102 RepID=UPI0024769ED7|nr:hypothetical protein [Kitasatospora sp. MAP5-34]
MERNAARTRAVRVIAVPAVALLALLTGCSSGATSAPTAAPSPGALGSLSVQGPRSHLELSGGVLRRNPSGTAELAVTVRNAGSVPEHLSLVSTPDNGRATLQGSKDNTLSTAGVLIRPGETATFGGDQGPTIAFPAHPGAASPSSTADAILIFSVTGLVHLQVAVTG